MTDLIRTERLSKRYGRVQVLRDVALNVPQGSIVGLIGPNGAGKTTLIRTLLNITRPDSGRAEVLGTDSRKLGPEQLASIGYVSENQELPQWMSVGYLLRYLAPFYPAWDHAAAEEIRQAFELDTGQTIRSLSRGMHMKLALTCSLAYHPALLILDEPFSGLDPVVRDDLTGMLLERAGERTILISSHDLAEIETFITHVAYLDRGTLHFVEQTAGLIQRFRQVEVVFAERSAAPRTWPEQWLQVEDSPSMLRFIHAGYDENSSPQQINQLLPGARQVNITPLGLRSIFVSLARNRRAPQETAR